MLRRFGTSRRAGEFQLHQTGDTLGLTMSWSREKWQAVRRFLERLGPYPSLLVLAVPVCLVEPLKLAALAVAGDGHWITGTAMIVAAYAASLLVVDRLFIIVKPKLLQLSWFTRLWASFLVLKYRLKSLRRIATP